MIWRRLQKRLIWSYSKHIHIYSESNKTTLSKISNNTRKPQRLIKLINHIQQLSSGSDNSTPASNIDYKEANTDLPPISDTNHKLISENWNLLPHVQPAIILTSDDGSPPVPHILEGENIDDHNDILRYEDSDTDQEANIDNL